MKPLLIALLFCMSCLVHAQTAADVFERNAPYQYTWLGIDYSHVKIVESLEAFVGGTPTSAEDVKGRYFGAWNYLIVKERSKYNIEEMMHKGYVAYDISMMAQVNDSANVKELVSAGPPFYTPEQIQEFVNRYPLVDRSGIGVLFVAESMNKRLEEAYYHVVIINMSSKEVLIQQRIMGKPSGAGLRNYWAGSYRDVMEQVGEKFYSKWKAMYFNNRSTTGQPNTTNPQTTQPKPAKPKPAW